MEERDLPKHEEELRGEGPAEEGAEEGPAKPAPSWKAPVGVGGRRSEYLWSDEDPEPDDDEDDVADEEVIREVHAAASEAEEEWSGEEAAQDASAGDEEPPARSSRAAIWLAALAFLLAVAAFAGSALGYLPLGGIKGEQLANRSISAEKLAPGAIGLDAVSLELREQLQGPPGPRGPRGPKGAPGTGLARIVIADREEQPNADGLAGGQVRCPRGKAISGGATILGAKASETVAITESTALEGRNGWRAAASQVHVPDIAEIEDLLADDDQRERRPGADAPREPEWRLQIHVICAVAAKGSN